MVDGTVPDIRSAFLTFDREDPGPAFPHREQTQLVRVTLTRTGYVLGHLRWNLEWRQYVFLPAAGAVYNARCLDDIRAELVALMDEWARSKGRKARLGAPKFDQQGTEGDRRVPRPRRKRSGDEAIADPHIKLTSAPLPADDTDPL